MEIKLNDYHKRVNAEMRVSVIFKVFRNLQVERTIKDNNGNVQPSSVNRQSFLDFQELLLETSASA